MGYQEGGGVSEFEQMLNNAPAGSPDLASIPDANAPTKQSGISMLQPFDFDTSVEKYQDRLSPYAGQQRPVSGYEAASMIGKGLLAQQAEKFPSIGRGLGMGFQELSAEIKKRREEKRKEKQAVAMKAMEMASQDEQASQKFLNDYSLKLIDLANKDIKTTKFDTSMLMDAKDAEGNPLINPLTGVGYTSEATLRANDPLINELLGLGANVIDRSGTTVNLGAGGNELDKKRAGNIAEAEATWQKEADAAGALRDQVLIARNLAEELGQENFGPVESLTMGLRGIMVNVGMGGIVDQSKLATQQALTQTSIGFVMALVGKTKGAISNKEMEIFFQASPTLGSTYDGYMRMLGYMDRIAELSEKYNAAWQEKSVELQGESISVINAEFAKFKTEFKSKPENKLIQTNEEKKYLEGIADKKTYNEVNGNYLNIQKESQKQNEQDSTAKVKADVIAEMANPETTTERRVYLQSLLDRLDQMEE
tara:strand:+ start:59 stop:1498 length:1440 start_codon:yes stop_codon:yes gene_type:complete